MNKKSFLSLLLLYSAVAHAVPLSPADSLKNFVKSIGVYNYMYPREQVYMHFDNTGYFMGEVIWFKAHVVSPQGFRPTALSRVLYVELLTPEGRIVKQQKLKIENGQCHGQIPLDEVLHAGSFLWGGDPTLELWTDNPKSFSPKDIEVIQNKDCVTVLVADSLKCDISLCSMEDFGLSYFQKVEDVSSFTFVGVNVPCYINVNKHNYQPYTFNGNVTVSSKTINNKSALVGNDITIGETTITDSGTLTIKAQNGVTLNAGFECKKGGVLEIK